MAAAEPPDLAQFRALYTEQHGWVWRLLRRLGVPGSALDDALQEVFIVVHRRHPEYDGRVPIRGWIAGIARKVAARQARTEGRARRKVDAFEPSPAPGPAPDERVGLMQAAALVERFLGELSPEQREVFVLAELEEWTAPEIAAALEIKVGTVWSRLHVARARFGEHTARWRAERAEEKRRAR